MAFIGFSLVTCPHRISQARVGLCFQMPAWQENLSGNLQLIVKPADGEGGAGGFNR
jgi:hypothetical protein